MAVNLQFRDESGGVRPSEAQSPPDWRDSIVGFYGRGDEKLGPLLADFFNTVPLAGPRSPLCEIMTSCGSDKGTWHNYTLLYNYLFQKQRERATDVFELGLGTNFTDIPANMGQHGIPGASLRGWRQYFPNAQIIGADIDRRILFSEKRIKTYYVDQVDKQAIDDLWAQFPGTSFNVMIDDGWHKFEANAVFMQNSLHKLKENGFYIVEDIVVSKDNLKKFDDFFAHIGITGAIVHLPLASNSIDNCLAIFCSEQPGAKLSYNEGLFPDLAAIEREREALAREHPHRSVWQRIVTRIARGIIKGINIMMRVKEKK